MQHSVAPVPSGSPVKEIVVGKLTPIARLVILLLWEYWSALKSCSPLPEATLPEKVLLLDFQTLMPYLLFELKTLAVIEQLAEYVNVIPSPLFRLTILPSTTLFAESPSHMPSPESHLESDTLLPRIVLLLL
jgi:hypothetical protein